MIHHRRVAQPEGGSDKQSAIPPHHYPPRGAGASSSGFGGRTRTAETEHGIPDDAMHTAVDGNRPAPAAELAEGHCCSAPANELPGGTSGAGDGVHRERYWPKGRRLVGKTILGTLAAGGQAELLRAGLHLLAVRRSPAVTCRGDHKYACRHTQQ